MSKSLETKNYYTVFWNTKRLAGRRTIQPGKMQTKRYGEGHTSGKNFTGVPNTAKFKIRNILIY